MKNRRGIFIAALLAVAAGAAFADGDQHVRYQNALLQRPLSAPDQAFCDQMTGGQQPAADKCHITRLFIQDILRNAEQGFPPLTDIRYVQSKDEKNRVLDKLTQYGG
ncbi:MAG: hypothetical protein NTX64_02855 [Elusimicrobia bacterium]|nr:hypothetical protein [Elusimicrobiota bacterium]